MGNCMRSSNYDTETKGGGNVKQRAKQLDKELAKNATPPAAPPPRLDVHEPDTVDQYEQLLKRLQEELKDALKYPLKFLELGLREKEMNAVTIHGLILAESKFGKKGDDRLKEVVQMYSDALKRLRDLKLRWKEHKRNTPQNIPTAKAAIIAMFGKARSKYPKLKLMSDKDVEGLFAVPAKASIRNR
mmetsp:Transcript_5487/g.8530  ORF Transcript_5487/g.8530 Transcript_5487/m.8530 type:complete len:187 (-) Transcript_5487:28-588(-)